MFSRQRLLNFVRGLGLQGQWDLDNTSETDNKVCYKCFPLEARHIQSLNGENKITTAGTPQEFHATLCHRIRNAQRRVYLASLYVGPAVDPQKYDKEAELLEALRHAARKANGKGKAEEPLDIKILLDLNRALRPVPISENESVTSAEACRRALAHDPNPTNTQQPPRIEQIFLISALTDFWQSILPNPFNEAMGVFHIKAYVVDDTMILSGANLSEEYFCDRHDRYLSVHEGGNGLVDCYADLVNALCKHAQVYTGDGVVEKSSTYSQRQQLLESVSKVIMTNPQSVDSSSGFTVDLDQAKAKTVAVAVPTFQAPPRFGHIASLRSDVDAVCDLIQQLPNKGGFQGILRMASAYLNPTPTFLDSCRGLFRTHFVTAERVSHGFKPKKKAGNKGKDWIPTVFDEIARPLISDQTSVWFYQRPKWTFHAKGLWLSVTNDNNDDKAETEPNVSSEFSDQEDLVAVTHGSGNFGARSELRDFESNLVLIFPPTDSSLADQHKQEWNEMARYAAHPSQEEEKKLEWSFKAVLPVIRSFF